ncbi:GNAT family N-acetyltransferase [Actinacidiphila acidipaludis]|uniref:GNAT family N-acetyltransferase n=1 Tax=Actinacidiphila acidipaludis TaxID=2873382 RepID=A0ABS7PYU5_9ACTN|nr:GNAT family N-acetyltransferase [Streptomyces acidipaludis]MBY8876065.1 GNAT family N-acetyltransferase [Streptomyces acidipaludis]
MEEPAETLSADLAELRRWRMADADALERAIGESLDHLVPWLPWAADHGRHQTVEFLARSHDEWRTGQAYGYAITLGGAVIGGCGLHRRIGPGGLEMGYWIHPRRTGQGLATMAAAALAGQAFRLAGVHRVEIHHDAANRASGAVARRLGFTEVERFRVAGGPAAPGEVGIDVIWRMSRERWETGAPDRASVV